MPIAVEKEETTFFPPERCVFCNKGTQYWSVKKDVTVCRACARKKRECDVPSKVVWISRGFQKRNSLQKQNPPVSGKSS